MKDCGFYTAKYLLCIFNFIFFVLGTIVLAIGIWLSIDKTSLIALLKITEAENLNEFSKAVLIEQAGYVLMIFGAILFLLSFLGFFGAIRESRCMLITFGILSILIFCAEIVFIVLGFFYRDEAQNYTKGFLRETIHTYYSTTGQTDMITLLWNKFMSSFSCCGVDNYADFEKTSGWLEHKGNRTIPEACCILRNVSELIPRDNDCVTDPNENNSYYNTGCYETLMNWLLDHCEIILGIILGIDVAIFFGIFFAFYLCKSVGRIHRLRL